MTIPGVPLSIPNNPSPVSGSVIPIKRFQREPLSTDIKYPIGFVVIIGKDPSTGNEGDLWWLSHFNSSGQAVWRQFFSGAHSPGVDFITTDDGSPPVQADSNGNINIFGGNGCKTSGTGPGATVTIDVISFGLNWSVITASTKTISVNEGYFANNVSGVSFTLPTTAAVGDLFIVTNISSGGFTILQNALQSIRIGTAVSTIGITGSIASTALGDSVILICSVANTNFIASVPPQGIISFV